MAWRWASRPGNDGRSDGWMFMTRRAKRSTNHGDRRRMYPARQIRRAPAASRAAAISRSCASRLGLRGWPTTRVGARRMRAACTPSADGSLAITRTTLASSSPAAIRSRIAARFEPRPDRRTPTRFLECPLAGTGASEKVAEKVEARRHDARQERQPQIDGGALRPPAQGLSEGHDEQDARPCAE